MLQIHIHPPVRGVRTIGETPLSVPGLTYEFHGTETQCQGRECLDVSLPKSRHRVTAMLAR